MNAQNDVAVSQDAQMQERVAAAIEDHALSAGQIISEQMTEHEERGNPSPPRFIP